MRRSQLFVLLSLLLLIAVLPLRSVEAHHAVSQEQVAAWLGRYSPNTTVELRGADLWLTRPPFASRLLPTATPDTFTFESGWVAGYLARFVPNETGGTSIMGGNGDGIWSEFARSGELYPDLGPSLIGALEAMLEQSVAEQGWPGALLYVYVPGRGIWMGARGLADIQRGIPMVPLDQVRIASVTKPFVAVVALQLVQEGWLRLDDSLERWLPGLVPGGDQINVRQLLNHTSGLPDYMSDAFVRRARATPWRVWSPAELVGEALRYPRRFAPGEPGRWAYSNTNYILVGMIIERVTGNVLEQELRQRIIEPLGLRSTALAPPALSGAGLARGYVGREDFTELNMSFAWAAGGITASVEDVGRFGRALFEGRLLRPDVQALLLELVGTGGAWGIGDLGYGLGVMQRTLPAAGLDAQAQIGRGHTGALAGYRTALWHFPRSGVTVVAATNRERAEPNLLVSRTLESLYQAGALPGG